ncbi:hypothetical protein ccbrp13_02630 [Ktedonobacteria bacterium brp13]|nr:hypothetical protein ccbrp13_02630 [Ktedonobacteria bacterium brp13]
MTSYAIRRKRWDIIMEAAVLAVVVIITITEVTALVADHTIIARRDPGDHAVAIGVVETVGEAGVAVGAGVAVHFTVVKEAVAVSHAWV